MHKYSAPPPPFPRPHTIDPDVGDMCLAATVEALYDWAERLGVCEIMHYCTKETGKEVSKSPG